jgi:glutathione S-transferase
MLRLIATRTSHFARKVRIVLRELELDFELRLVSSLLHTDRAEFGGNPLMQVPTLVDGETWIIESDNIARYLVETRAPHDPLNILDLSTMELRQLAVLNGIMAHEAQIVLAGVSGASGLQSAHLHKLNAAIACGLSWLDGVVDAPRAGFGYIDVAMVCMWDHHLHFGIAPSAECFPHLAERVARFAQRESVAATTPGASLMALSL